MVLGNTRMGGAQAFILNILRNIDRSKFQIDFAINFYAESNGIEDECRRLGSKFFILPYFKIYNYLNYHRAWKKFLITNHYDIVYAHSTNSASIFLKIAKGLGIKTIAHSHSAGFRGGIIEQAAKKFFAKGVGKYADYWFACSDKAAERLYGKEYRSYSHYYDIPNAIDVTKYLFNDDIRASIRRKYGVEDGTFLCGHVGTFSQPKNHKYLIDVFTEYVKINGNSKLICCGAGALRPEIENYAKYKGVFEKIIFAGVVNNSNEVMMAMDTFIFPSIFEGFPVSILEAQASGLPILLSDVITNEVDLTDLVHRLSIKDDPKVWTAAIEKNKRITNRSKYNEILAISRYNVSEAIKQFETLYTQLANQ